MPEVTPSKTIDTALWELTKLILDSPDFADVVQSVVNNILIDLGYFEKGYRILVLTLVDPKRQVLQRIALSQTPEAAKTLEVSAVPFEQIDIPLSQTDNLLIQTLNTKQVHTTQNWHEIFRPVLTEEQARRNQTAAGIHTSMLYPLLVKNQAIGVLICSMIKGENEVTEEEKTLISRFTDIVALAVQNASIYSNLKELDHLKDEFLVFASHELRTPLTAIQGYAGVLLKQPAMLGTLTEKQEQHVEVIFDSSRRLIKLVGEMLDLSRIEAGRFEINPQPTDLIQLVQTALTEVLPTAQLHQLTLTTQPPPSPLPRVMADQDKIKEVVINIIGNSIKFTPPGGSITISFARQGDFIQTTITDTGKGLRPEDMQYIFQEYGMVKRNYLQREVNQGSGLGLYISRSFIKLHGGEISLHSKGENQGTTVTFTLKVAE